MNALSPPSDPLTRKVADGWQIAHEGKWIASSLSLLAVTRGLIHLLAAAGAAGETFRFLGGAEQRLRLVDAFLLLEGRI